MHMEKRDTPVNGARWSEHAVNDNNTHEDVARYRP